MKRAQKLARNAGPNSQLSTPMKESVMLGLIKDIRIASNNATNFWASYEHSNYGSLMAFSGLEVTIVNNIAPWGRTFSIFHRAPIRIYGNVAVARSFFNVSATTTNTKIPPVDSFHTTREVPASPVDSFHPTLEVPVSPVDSFHPTLETPVSPPLLGVGFV